MIGWINRLEKYSKLLLMAMSLGLVLAVGLVDYVTGYEMSFFVFYLIPVAMGVWFVGDVFGVILSVLSVAVSVAGDLTAGAHSSRPFVPVWNSIIEVVFLVIVVAILTRLRKLNRELEGRVRQRTAALTSEIGERARLERELLRISEREQHRIGHDLHDSLCQHLTGTALAGQVLQEKLSARGIPEQMSARQVVKLVEEAIDLTRSLARGLHPVELEGEGFTDSFRELAANISERFKIHCGFECTDSARIQAPEGAIHLYRITQEAITNSIKHGKAANIIIRLEHQASPIDATAGNPDGRIFVDVGNPKLTLALSITDDGIGLPEKARIGPGMGLRIMAYRASVIGGTFHIERLPGRGTRAVCTLPAIPPAASESHATKEQGIAG